MRRLLASASVALAALATAGGFSPAIAQEPAYTVESDIDMTPRKAGTEERPRGIELAGNLRFTTEPGTERPVITAGRMLLPRGIAYNGHRHPKCSAEAFGRGGASLEHCIDRSTTGAGSTPDFVGMYPFVPRVVFVNGGARRIWAYATFFSPAFVQEPISIGVKRLDGPQWGYELSFQVPANLQVIAGVPITIPHFRFAIGGKRYAPRYLTTDGGCPKRGFMPYKASFSYRYHPDGPTGEVSDRGRLACK